MRFLLFLTVFLAAGCAKDNGSGPPSSAGADERKAAIATAGLAANAKKLTTGRFRLACDDAIEPLRQALAADLESRAAEIDAFRRKHGGDSGTYRIVPFGPTYARERLRPPVIQPGWTEDPHSWRELAGDYSKIKGTPVDARWVALDDEVRGIIIDDVDRVVGGYNYQIDEASEAPVERLLGELRACEADPACESPAFSPESLAFIQSKYRIKRHYDLLVRPQSHEEKREDLKDFIDWETSDHHLFAFTPNLLLRKTASGRFTLTLDPGAFAGAADQLRRYVEEVWSDGSHSVTLDLRAADGAYRVVLGNEAGGRSYVLREEKTVNLNPNVRARSVAHEIGHVLGFADYYFDVFDPDTCDWRTRVRDDDLMSGSGTGSVLPRHWEELERRYK